MKLIILLFVLFQSPNAQKPSHPVVLEINQIKELYDNIPDSAVTRVIDLLKKESELNDSLKYEIYFLAGEVFDNVSAHTQALKFHLKAAELKIKNGKRNLLENYSEIFELYSSLRDKEKCHIYKRLIYDEIQRGVYSTISAAEAYYDLGTYFWYFGEYDSSLTSMDKAIELYKSVKPINFERIGYIKMEMAETYFRLKKHYKVDQLLEEVLSDSSFNAYTLYLRYSVIYIQSMQAFTQKRYELCFQLADSVLTVAKENSLLEEESNVLKTVTQFYEETGNYQEALSCLKRREEILQLLQDKEKRFSRDILDVEYQVNEKERKLSYQATLISQQNIIILIVSVASIIVLGLFIILLIISKRVQKKNTQIETLMRELHHRVKNNLQVISSLLGLQSSKLEDETAQKAVEEGQERIRAMSLIHQKLYQQDDVTSVNLKEYLETLVNEISESYGYSGKTELRIKIPEMPMDVDTTMPIGLIVNELVSNSFKYAFKDIEKPILKLELIEKSKGKYEFSVSDNGAGLPEGFNVKKAKSFGLKLVGLLVRQLDANLEVKQEAGLEYKLAFSA